MSVSSASEGIVDKEAFEKDEGLEASGGGYASPWPPRPSSPRRLPWERGRPARMRFVGAKRPGETLILILRRLRGFNPDSYLRELRPGHQGRNKAMRAGRPRSQGEDGGGLLDPG
jgi:hypothetical protein